MHHLHFMLLFHKCDMQMYDSFTFPRNNSHKKLRFISFLLINRSDLLIKSAKNIAVTGKTQNDALKAAAQTVFPLTADIRYGKCLPYSANSKKAAPRRRGGFISS